MHSIYDHIGVAFCFILPAVHADTVCDAVSPMSGVCKKTAYNIVTQKGADTFTDVVVLGGNDDKWSIATASTFSGTLYYPQNIRTVRTVISFIVITTVARTSILLLSIWMYDDSLVSINDK